MSAEEQALLEKGRTIYTELCFACHGEDGRGQTKEGTPMTMAPPLASSTRVLGHRDYTVKVLLHGLTGPLNGTTYSEIMIPMGQQNDEWIAAIASYVRNSFGNRAAMITPAEVARVRAATTTRRTSWSATEVESSLPRQLVVDPSWKLTASQNPAIASYALSTQQWTTGLPQAAGMWLQVELPQAAMLTEIQFESNPAPVIPDPIVPGAPPRSGGGVPAAGRGAAPGTPAPAPPGLGYPRGYQVQVSMDGTTWSAPVAQGKGTGATTAIAFAPVRAKFVRITQTATPADQTPWTVLKMRLFEAPAATPGGR
jgi:mono/diheme cytochrome c family protein